MSGGNSSSSDAAPHPAPVGDAVPMEEMARHADADADEAAPSTSHSDAADAAPPTASTTDTSKGKDRDPDALSKQRRESIAAIGPAQDDNRHTAPMGDDGGPVCIITLLLTSGSRHPYKIDARYLARRNVVIPDETEDGHPDPFSISVYTLKELILREWRNDWETKPNSPSSIRLIHFGKLLDDKEQLKKYQFSTENPNVVHMSIRPSDLDEEEPKSGGKSLPAGSGDGQRSRSGNGCCTIL
ncbi:Ubiquitin [Ophiocordyceps camponoti-floridani]|uniref:Ubiquitin n=1 Tax=Ophiocordyceps camponoti-floridani TaxID=2030778 RepID=A0A8H4Q642_9HYPO|nr:Ubiquitin [Ophiocordyceps camponoti-floridani]